MNDQKPSFDKVWMLAQIGGDEDLLHEVAQVFLLDYPRLKEILSKALSSHDSQALHAAAHATKSAVGNFGATAAVEAAKALEAACKEEVRAYYAERYQTLLEQVDRLAAELKAELGE